MKPISLSTPMLEQALNEIRAGKPIAMPTETVYGLAADASSDDAIARVYAMKQRPSYNPLIVHVASVEMAKRYGEWNALAEALAAEHWPGPLTLVLPLKADANVVTAVTAGGDTIALRMPAHPVAQEILSAFDGGLAAPSANRSGKISPTRALHVKSEFPDETLLVVDGGAAQIGLESTVVDCTNDQPKVLRPGSVLVGVSNDPITSSSETLKSPGQLASHYAPSKPVRLSASHVEPDEALLAFGAVVPAGALLTENLSASADVEEAAANFYAMLRVLDASEAKTIAVMPIPEEGLGIAINDRLRRAAAKRTKNSD